MKTAKLMSIVLPVLWLAVLGSAMQVIYARHKARDMFVHLEKLNAERDSLEMEWAACSSNRAIGHRTLSSSAWRTPSCNESAADSGRADRATVKLKVIAKPRYRRKRGSGAQLPLALGRGAGAGRGGCRRPRCARGGTAIAGSQLPREAGRRPLHARGENRRASRRDHRSLRRTAGHQHRRSTACG